MYNESYKFLEKNFLKRRYRNIVVFQTILKIFVSAFHFFEEFDAISFILSFILGQKFFIKK